jgi:hypothetical protein
MTTHFQITFPQHPGQAFPIAASNGQTLPGRARSDIRPKKGYPVRILTRAEWDDQNKVSGPYLAAYQPKRPVPDVDFEAEDGSLHKTAEACLAHELKARFGVETLAEVEELLRDWNNAKESAKTPATVTLDSAAKFVSDAEAIAATLNATDTKTSIVDAIKQPKAVEPPAPTDDEARRLLASALSQRGLKPAEAARATGLTSQQCRAVVAAYPDTFREHAGKLFLNS